MRKILELYHEIYDIIAMILIQITGGIIMDFSKLEKHIIDVIKEEQIKLGYRSEVVRLYYPLNSLNQFLSDDFDIEQMHKVLEDFIDYVENRLGKIQVSNVGERFCLAIPEVGVDYVHEHMDHTEFIYDFIKTIEKHGCTIEDVLQTFYHHSEHVHVEKVDHGEFDYLVYFEDGEPDDFRYCITDEGCHIIYHRFMPGDYEDFAF